VLTGNTPDISEFLEFSWFQPVWYYEPSAFPEQNRYIARWIGVPHRVGQAMCFWILPISGTPIARTTVQAIEKLELETIEVKSKLVAYDKAIEEKFEMNSESSNVYLPLYREDEEPEDIEQEPMDNDAAAIVIDEISNDAYDELLHVKPILHRDG
jgi:hypothetical protein